MWLLEGEDWHAICARVRRQASTVVWSFAAVRLPGKDPRLFILNVRSDVSVEPKDLDYGRLIISTQQLPPEEAAERLLNGTTGPLHGQPEGFSFVKMPAEQTAQPWWLTSGQSWGFGPPVEWPTYFFEWRLMDRDELTWQARWDDALAKPGLPPYNRAADAVFELIYGTSPSIHPQQLYPQVVVRLADSRARLSSVEMARSKMRVSVEEGLPRTSSEFLLQANWRLPEERETKHAEQPVSNPGSFSFDVGVQPLEFGVFLLDPDGNQVDAKTWKPANEKPPMFVPQMSRGPLKRTRPAPPAPFDLRSDLVPDFPVPQAQATHRQAGRAKRVKAGTTGKPVHAGGFAKAEDPKAVLVVHGRNGKVTSALFEYLRALGLRPAEWGHLVKQTGQGSPYIGEVLGVAFRKAQAVVVLFTGDDEAQLLPALRKKGDPSHETRLTPQPRQNVLFEAGMAIGWDERRTIIVEFGERRPFSDIGGRHTIQITSGPDWRAALADRLRNTGCEVDQSGSHWLTAGRFPRPPRTAAVSIDTNDPRRSAKVPADPNGRRLGAASRSASTVSSEDPGAATSPERQMRERISSLVQSRFGAYRLNDDERASIRETLFAAGRNVEIDFDYQQVRNGDDWSLLFTPDLGAYGVGSDGRKETLEQLAQIHKRLVRTVRSWDEWRAIPR